MRANPPGRKAGLARVLFMAYHGVTVGQILGRSRRKESVMLRRSRFETGTATTLWLTTPRVVAGGQGIAR